MRLRTSYPVLPWIGVIALGYLMGPWFGRARRSSASAGCCGQASARWPCSRCCGSPTSMGMPLVVPDHYAAHVVEHLQRHQVPAVIAVPVADPGRGAVAAALVRMAAPRACAAPVSDIGAAPMFFYLLHLYVLKGLYLAALAAWGRPMANCMPWIRSAACCWWPVRWRWCCTRRRGPSRGSKREGAICLGCDTCERWRRGAPSLHGVDPPAAACPGPEAYNRALSAVPAVDDRCRLCFRRLPGPPQGRLRLLLH